jgi:cell filamentation protein
MAEGPRGKFDANHLKAIHRHIFQDVYEWAGRTRDQRVRLSDGAVASEPIMRTPGDKAFTLGPAIPKALTAFATSLRAANYLRGLPRQTFAYQAADRMAELNVIHTFREGNGRAQRLFIMELAQAAGHRLDFSVVSGERMMLASIAAHERGEPGMIRRMFVGQTEDLPDPRPDRGENFVLQPTAWPDPA